MLPWSVVLASTKATAASASVTACYTSPPRRLECSGHDLVLCFFAICWAGWTLYKLVDSIGQDLERFGDE